MTNQMSAFGSTTNDKLSLKTYLLLSLFLLVFFNDNPVNIFSGISVLSTSLVALFSAFWLSRNKNCRFLFPPSEALSIVSSIWSNSAILDARVEFGGLTVCESSISVAWL